MKKKLIAVGAAAAAVVTVAGCSTVSTQFDETAVHYKGGNMSSRTFANCIPVSKHETNGPGDHYYIYPTNQRSFDFTGDADSESAPITITAKGQKNQDGTQSGSAQVLLPGVATFTLNTDCDVLRKFHENLGNKYKAWWGGTDFEDEDKNRNNVPDGWENMLRFVWGNALKNVAQDIGSEYTWQDLYNDSTSRLKLQGQIQQALVGQIKRLDGSGDVDYFLSPSVTLNQPNLVDPDLKKTIVGQQAAVAKAQSAKAEADAQKAAARAQVDVKNAEADAIRERVRLLGPDGYVKEEAIKAGMNPYPNPVVAGSAGH
jgi:hypothetical protein